MFYDYANFYDELPEDVPFSVGIIRPDNLMFIAWGDNKMTVDGEGMRKVIDCMMMAYEEWMVGEIARSN
jgi:hypothetical protein